MHHDHDEESSASSDLKNIGPVSLRWLHSIGIRTREHLAYVGVSRAYLLIKSQYPEASLNLLWALQGALTGESWNRLSEETKKSLKREVGIN